MLKKSVVASLVGNFSPVNSSRAIFVRSARHFRGEIGDVLKRRAAYGLDLLRYRVSNGTILEDCCPIKLECLIGVFILLRVAHCDRERVCICLPAVRPLASRISSVAP